MANMEQVERHVMMIAAMRGISRAKPGSVRRLVEAAKGAVEGLCNPAISGTEVTSRLVSFSTALAEIELEDK